MTQSPSPQTAEEVRRKYLEALDVALAPVPYGVARELRSGITEELDGLTLDRARQRIAELGDPAQIAGAALEGARSAGRTGDATPVVAVNGTEQLSPARAPRRYLVDTSGFAFTAVSILGLGGLLVPFLGWIIGVSLVTSSRFWYRWEKAIAVVTPIVAVMVTGAAFAWFVTPVAVENPLSPAPHVVVLGVMAVSSLAGAAWLFLRLRGRAEPVTRSRREQLDPSLGLKS